MDTPTGRRRRRINLLELAAKITLDSSEYEQGIKSATGKIKSFGATALKIGAAAAGAAAAGIAAFATASVEAGMEFNKSMSQVAATMGKTKEEIGELSDFAREMGKSTAFSASEAADALNYMALAGYDAETSMKMLPNVLNLAAAGGIELASASDMITDAQSALGLTLDETSAMVDKMAKAASKSNTSVGQLGDAMLTVGGTAKSLAGGTTELSTALGVLADNGIKGAEGGTALRNIILALSAPTNTAAKKMKSLGIEAYDANGNLRKLSDIFSDLNAVMADMTQGEQTEVLNTLFNKVDLKSANALLATSSERWEELSSAIDDSAGAAQQMADTQLDNLAGDITRFQSALGEAKIALSESLDPSLRGLVQNGTSAIQELTDKFGEEGLAGAAKAAAGVIAASFGQLAGTLVHDFENTKLFHILAGVSMAISGDWVGAIEEFKSAFSKATDDMAAKEATLWDVAMENFGAAYNGIGDGSLILADDINRARQSIAEKNARAAEKEAQAMRGSYERALQGLDPVFSGFADQGSGAFSRVASAAEDSAAKASNSATKATEALQTAQNGANDLMNKSGAALGNVSDAVDGASESMGGLSDVSEAFAESVTMQFTTAATATTAAWQPVPGEMGAIWNGIKSAFPVGESRTWGVHLVQNFQAGVKSWIGNLMSTVRSMAAGIRNLIGFSEPKEGPLSDFHTYAPDMVDLFIKGLKDNSDKLRDEVQSAFDFSGIAAPVPAYGDMTEETYTTVEEGGGNGSNEKIDQLIGLLAKYLPGIAEKDVVLDTGEVVGALLPAIDEGLGELESFARRSNA